MNQPTRRRSSLSGTSPVTPPTSALLAEQPAQAIERVPAEQVAPVDGPAPTRTDGSRAGQRSKYPPKVSFYQDPADTSRVRGAILHTMTTEGSRSLSQFIHHAVMAEVERLEAKYNAGRPFPPVAVRELPQGRPMGE